MIDVESKVFQHCADAFHAEYPNGYISPEYVPQPPCFPACSVVEMDNTVHASAMDNGSIENAADVMYQVDIYSNLIDGKKVQAKAILALIDNQMSGYRFQRTYSNPVPNYNDARVYRITARYRRMITTTEQI